MQEEIIRKLVLPSAICGNDIYIADTLPHSPGDDQAVLRHYYRCHQFSAVNKYIFT